MTDKNFYYVYVLEGKNKFIYIGYTAALDARVLRHNSGMVQSTKAYVPLMLVFYEAYLNKYDALRRERYLKSTKGKTTLRSMLKEYLQ